MTKPTHTPGPWTNGASNGSNPDGYCRISGRRTPDAPYTIVVAETYGYKGEREANARLIAAAPEMLEALRECFRALEATRSPLILLGDYIGNEHDGTGVSGVPAFDRCDIIGTALTAANNALATIRKAEGK